MRKQTFLLTGLLVGAAGMAAAANPVSVGASGDFATIQAAVSSFASGGANAGETPPFVINVDPASGPYDEALALDDSAAGVGDIQGDIVIQSDTAGTLVPVALQDSGGGDGLIIFQETANVTFRDMLFYPSTTNGIDDDMIRMDGNATTTDTTDNLILFESCIFTEIDGSGNPLITAKEQAMQPAPASVGSNRTNSFPYMIQHWGDAGEVFSTRLDDCAVYGNIQNATMRVAFVDGAAGTGESFEVNNSIIAGGGYLLRTGSSDGGGEITITDSMFYDPIDGQHCFWASGGNTEVTPATFTGTTFYDPSIPGGSPASRGISGSTSVDILSITDCLFYTPGPNIVDGPDNTYTVTDTTFHTTTAENAFFLVAGTGGITVEDSIFSGDGNKIAGDTPSGSGFSVDYVAFVESGPYTIGARTDGLITVTEGLNIVTADPGYATTDPTSANFLDVTNTAYETANSTGGALTGGANFLTFASAGGWELYQ